jgi:hypothetical protein
MDFRRNLGHPLANDSGKSGQRLSFPKTKPHLFLTHNNFNFVMGLKILNNHNDQHKNLVHFDPSRAQYIHCHSGLGFGEVTVGLEY